LESFSKQGYELFPRLETLYINDPSVLTTSFCEYLTSLRRLDLAYSVLTVTEVQVRALVLLTSLKELQFYNCHSLVDLPAGLHLLPSLKRLKISFCQGISRLPETGLPLSLEELYIYECSNELNDQCAGLATSKLRVKINEYW
jgi:Leucine-rich repeat (LRR) protein